MTVADMDYEGLLQGGELEVDEEMQQLYEHFRMEVDRGQEPLRIDKYLTEHMQVGWYYYEWSQKPIK